ncbi:MAG TPA: efflux RND transporter periplasmic adaptor subunit [Rhodopila sp.]|nr:efflux RND transporter periplasmic adaptor subunit [Rhodopila sp.]
MRRARTVPCGIALVVAMSLLVSCKKSNQFVPPPPAKVSVAKPLVQTVTQYLEETGNTSSIASVDLVARVEGFVQAISYTDGAEVKKGDILFTIEPLPYQMKLQQAQATEAADLATLTNAQINFERQQSLQRGNVASVQNLEDARATRDTAQANLTGAQANTQQAAITYSYTRVLAPFDGRVTAHLVSVGDLVGTSPTKLATIVQMNPIYVNFSVGEQDVIRVRADIRRHGGPPEDITKVPVEIGLQGEIGYPHVGHIDYVAPQVDPSTGTLQARGILDNTDRSLLAGYFARVRVPIGTEPNALLVPDTALGADQGGAYVLVVGSDQRVVEKHVTRGSLHGNLRVIRSGLTPDDVVVVNGVERATPGQVVAPTTVTLKADGS